MGSRAGQVAFEYMVIVAVVIAMLIPIWAYLASLSQGASESLSISQAQTAAKKLASAADLVYTQGSPSQLIMDVYIPAGVESASLTNSTVIFRLYSSGAVTDVSATSLAALQGSVPRQQGLYRFTVKAEAGYANISYQQ